MGWSSPKLNTDRARGAGTADIAAATQGVVRLVSLLSLVGGAVLLAITLIGRRTRQAAEIASPAS